MSKTLEDKNMTTWRDAEKFLSSLWLLDREDDRPLDFHGAFVPDVARGLILRHTQPGDWVWDPTAGSGTTGIVAKELDRHCIMSDLTPLDVDQDLVEYPVLPGNVCDVKIASAFDGLISKFDGRSLRFPQLQSDKPDEHEPCFQFDLVIFHPPYHNIIQFSDKEGDMSNCPAVDWFFPLFQAACQNIFQHLRLGGFLGLVIGDIWENGGTIPLGFRCMHLAMLEAGLGGRLKAIVVKDIKNNRHNAKNENLMKSRFFRWGAVAFQHEYIFSIQKGKGKSGS